MTEISQSFDVSYRYSVSFTRSAFSVENEVLRHTLGRAGNRCHRVMVVIDSGVDQADPGLRSRLQRYAEHHNDTIELVGDPLIVRGGEICKHDPAEVVEFHDRVAKEGICRHSFVLAIGGGAVLDLAGYAAATAHRGLRLIRMPSTVLAQNDAGIGVKNGVNFDGRKNFIGTFAPPFAVINDFALLDSLPERDLRAGIAEAVKVGLIRDGAFFSRLHGARSALANFDRFAMEEMIIRCAELHLEHIRTSGDPFELGSARPLDFGHWAAHKLEERSAGALRHGEAVAIGIAIDSLYSHHLGMLGEGDLHRILETLEGVGFELSTPALADLKIERALSEFREHLGGELCITLLDGVGRGVEVSEVDVEVMGKCVERLRRGWDSSC